MQDLFIEFLPPWVETGLQPAFYDRESGTVLQQTARMYAKVNELVKAVNGMDKVIKEYVDYIDNYFKNLDVQEEINNKLDDMAEGGELAEFIALYANLPCVHAYATISDMASSENLEDGSYARAMSKTVAGTGDGFYYKIREIESGDDPDGENLVAVGDTLVAEKIPDANLDGAINTINGSIADIQEEIEAINNRKTHDIKFVADNECYDVTYNLTSAYNGLTFEMLKQINGNFPSIQGCALWRKNGQVVFNNATEIYTMSNSAHPTKTVLQSGNYGHGGDCCILRDNMFIGDGDSNTIIRVNLNNGNKFLYVLDNDIIKNEAHSSYEPVLAGVCMGDGTSKIYCLVVDKENDDHSIKTGATVRVYEYIFATGVTTKIFEYNQDICYGQGITRDEKYFFIAGNKPFTGNYSGNIITIVDAETGTVFDKIENNSDYEFEGLDYGATDGITGLITACAKWGTKCRYGIYAYYGNCTKYHLIYNNYTANDFTLNAWAVKTRGGFVKVNFKIEGTFEAGQTYTFANFFNNSFPLANAGGTIGFIPIPLAGYTRAFDGYAEWDYARSYGESGENDLKVYVRSGSASSTIITGSVLYTSC